MNLGKAKMILIIAFAGLNLFLGYYLFWPEVGRLASNGSFSPEEQRLAEEWLNENNYFIQVPMDRSVRVSDFITVTTDFRLRAQLIDRFAETVIFPVETIQSLYYRGDEEVMVVHSNGLLQLRFQPHLALNAGAETAAGQTLQNAAVDLLTREGLMPEGLRFDYIESKQDDQYILNYIQVFDGLPLYAGTFKIYIKNDMIEQVDIYLLSPLEGSPDREIETIAAVEALTRLVEDLGPSDTPREVTRFEFGYYSGEYDAEKWEVPPVWRFILDDGQYYYVNAFTGNIEYEAIIPEQLQ